jgi:hypothetical protein
MAPSVWRPVEHPDLSQVLVHFCHRGRRPRVNDYVPPNIQNMDGGKRLASILWDRHLRAFRTFSQGNPVVCFSESTMRGSEFLVKKRGYNPWGLMVDRHDFYDAGGGPVWYARTAEYKEVPRLARSYRHWTVEFEPNSDWLEEREWRITPEETSEPPQTVPLTRLTIVGLLVGDSRWNGMGVAPIAPDGVGDSLPPGIGGVPRYCWDSDTTTFRKISPLYS